ncbi:probable 28S ribosomal protein S26, mitochondrial [Copidosoma floridanum]|uniref:probable 28S ribosomal protein S26, mitochondrial n=1 Tax=Copidosoma floridanum TaxID=29053 RepID=UPI0006C9DDCE|nr:probable 28S ribosomal protein S26, mitochondrial [Copidosoma floridanum]
MLVAKLLGSSPLVTNATHTCSFINSVFTQSLRWKRKPIWLPTAKTKVFRVPKRPKIPEDEFKEIQRLYNNYRTYLRSTLKYFKEINKQNEIQLDPAVIEKAEQEDFEKCNQINDEWNKQIAADREIRLAKENEEKRLKIMLNIERQKEKKKLLQEQADDKIKKLKILSSTIITRKNIDEAIENALENPINYNKAINIDGEWYTEPTGIPPPKIPVTTDVQTEQARQ